mgnify:CR=1 FL=1
MNEGQSMDSDSNAPDPEDPLKFDRTRDADLHQAIKAHGFKVPRELLERSSWNIFSSGVRPFLYIGAAIGICRLPVPIWAALVFAFFPVLAAQRAFLTLVHDASHKLYSTDRRRNDLLANYFAAGYIGMLVRKYRKIHLAHHAANGSLDDPEFFGYEAVTRAGGWTKFVLSYAFGLQIAYLLGKYHVKQDEYLGKARVRSASVDEHGRLEKISIFVCQGVLLSTFALAGVWYLYGLWLYVAVSWAPLLSRLRFLAEHPGHGELTMSTRGTWWERIYIAPYHFNFHLEHHLWPSMPPYNLPKAHALLHDSGFFAVRPDFLAPSFMTTLAQYGRKWTIDNA